MRTRPSVIDHTVFGVDVQSGDVRGGTASYALVVLDGDDVTRDVVTRRKLLRLIASDEPALVATDNVYELATDKRDLVHLLSELPDGTRLVQVTGAERPEPLSRVASRHGVPYEKDPMSEAEAAANLAAVTVGYEVTVFTDTTEVKVARNRSPGGGGWSEDRYTRRIHGNVRRVARRVEADLEEAGLSFDVDVTEKYGGYANAVFTVDATPEALPVSSRRSGDVRVEVERVQRDGITFEPLAKRRDHVIVGVDPGTTTGVAVVGLDGGVLDVHSTRTVDRAGVIEWIVERGRPVVVAADVTPMPETVDRVRRSFDAAGWEPDTDLPVDEKLHRTREHGYETDHERDALAAALFAFDAYRDRIDAIAEQVPPRVRLGEVVSRIVAGDDTVEHAIAALTETTDQDAEPDQHEPRELTPEERHINRLEGRIERLEDHVEALRATVDEKGDRIEELEADLDTARQREREAVRERRTVTRLERTIERLETDLETEREENAALTEKLERLKTLWRLDHAHFDDVAGDGVVPVKPVAQFTTAAIDAADERFGLSAGDVVWLRDASGAGRKTAERLAAVDPRLVLRSGGLSGVADEVLFDADVPVAPVDDVEIQEIDDLVVADAADVDAALEDWRDRAEDRRRERRASMIDRVISEHRADGDR